MKNINALIKELVTYGINTGLIDEADVVYSTNRLLEFFKLEDYSIDSNDSLNTDSYDTANNTKGRNLHLILEDMIDYALETGLLENDTITYKDLYDTAIMGLITPPPSAIQSKFFKLYDINQTDSDQKSANSKKATDFYYEFSRATNYIRTDRIAKDEKWITSTEFGDLDITINLSKPEKDPRDIAAAGQAKKSGYPACLLCRENEGYAGTLTHPARQNHRIIPISLDGEQYYLQYSPYVYYNEHCIIFNKKHTPMKIDRSTMKKLLSFVDLFPHYTAGSNADLPIVGGSILSHDHFQGGGYEFPMVRAPYENEFTIPDFEDIHAGIIKWPLSTIRLQGKNIDRIVDLADHILGKWKSYTDETAFIFAETKGEPHNTITPIARMRNSSNASGLHNSSNLDPGSVNEYVYELDLVLRNNITTDEHPLGVYHPHAEYHHIKKENIGLIEVMGLAVLPARLKKEMAFLAEVILSGGNLYSAGGSHADWAASFLPKYGIPVDADGNVDNTKIADLLDIEKNDETEGASKIDTFDEKNGTCSNDKATKWIMNIIHQEIGYVFTGVLEDAGVFKRNKEGNEAFARFIDTL